MLVGLVLPLSRLQMFLSVRELCMPLEESPRLSRIGRSVPSARLDGCFLACTNGPFHRWVDFKLDTNLSHGLKASVVLIYVILGLVWMCHCQHRVNDLIRTNTLPSAPNVGRTKTLRLGALDAKSAVHLQDWGRYRCL